MASQVLNRARASFTEPTMLKPLKRSITTPAHSAPLAISGSVPIRYSIVRNLDTPSVRPIQLRFGKDGEGSTLTFPHTRASSEPLQQLLTAASPTTMLRSGQEVLDTDYREVGKLNANQFATNFCPHAGGVLDTVAPQLLPFAGCDKEKRGVVAEIVRWNAYSAPGGKFKLHSDAAQNEKHFGRLVVALPTEFEGEHALPCKLNVLLLMLTLSSGGELILRSKGQELVCDWSKAATPAGYAPSALPTIPWVAFHNGCQHEVREVTAGHRFTLTYSLYAT